MFASKNLRKLTLIAVVSVFYFCAWGQSDDDARTEIKVHREKQEKKFRDKNTSPLETMDFKKFKGLNYYAIDLKYRIHARFVKYETPVLFKMKTTTSRLPDYVKYGEVRFTLDSVEYMLEVYQNIQQSKMKGFEDLLFIAFTDQTNGHETYDVGRYIELAIPAGEDVIVDFNQSYNPYCSYSAGYSCPIPPEENNLPIAIKAGEKKFKETNSH